MPLWKGIIGRSFTTESFVDYCRQLHWTTWRPSFVVLHNTAIPNLLQRPHGFTQEHMTSLERYYRDEKQWSAGPHLFIDDLQIWVFTPLTVSGVHSPSWNSISLGFEMLGDYETESFSAGRGLRVRQNTISALRTIHSVLGINPNTLKLHREDELTSHACPGRNVRKLEMIQALSDALLSIHMGEHLS